MADIRQPIETAPLDGTRVLVYVPGDDPNDEYSGWFTAWYENGCWHTGLRNTIDSYSEIDQPSFWMPLPNNEEK